MYRPTTLPVVIVIMVNTTDDARSTDNIISSLIL